MNRRKFNLIWLIQHITQITGMGVSTKIFVAFFIVTFSITTAISFFSMSKIGEKIKGIEQRRAIVVLNNTINQLTEQTKALEGYIRLLSDSQDLEIAVAENKVKRIYEVLTPAKYYSENDKILVYNHLHKQIAELRDFQAASNDEELVLIKQALSGVTTSGLEVTGNGLEIFAATPIHFDPTEYGEHMPAGALLVDRHIDNEELAVIKKREGVEINIFYAGKLISSSMEKSLQTKILPDLQAAIKQGDKFQIVNPSGETQYLSAWDNIGDNGLIAVLVPNEELLTVSRDLTRDISGITLLAGIVVFFSSFFLAKLLISPLSKMLDTTNAITNADFSQKVDIFSYDEFGKLGSAINYMLDKIKERLDMAEYLASVDGLTGLYNHRLFQQRLGEELLKAERLNIPCSLIIIDIDYFKQYNDTNGHPAGDQVLQQMSQILNRNIRGVDLAARYGGEEFAVILYNTGPEGALIVGERIRMDVETYPFKGREEQPTGKVTVSMGVATYPENAMKKDELIKLADDALYKAKYTSRNMVVLYYSVLDELKSGLDSSERDLLNTIKTLISVINSKDRYTFGHSERVVQYSMKIAEALGLSDEVKKTIKVGAYLHDIGKIEIDRELLNKEGILDVEQHEVLKQHSSWGAQIVSSVKSLSHVVPVILHHHEKYNGEGYPLGLKGDEIPLEARILKVADSFDAMTTSRPYQPIKSFVDARAELIKCANQDFDPVLVEIFLEILESEYPEKFITQKGEPENEESEVFTAITGSNNTGIGAYR